MSIVLGWEEGVEGNFPIHRAVVEGKIAPMRLPFSRNNRLLCSHAKRDEGGFGRVLWHIGLDEDCQSLRQFTRWTTKEILPKGKSLFVDTD